MSTGSVPPWRVLVSCVAAVLIHWSVVVVAIEQLAVESRAQADGILLMVIR